LYFYKKHSKCTLVDKFIDKVKSFFKERVFLNGDISINDSSYVNSRLIDLFDTDISKYSLLHYILEYSINIEVLEFIFDFIIQEN
jgi:hypothetical protein